jgi:hypothetical protein
MSKLFRGWIPEFFLKMEDQPIESTLLGIFHAAFHLSWIKIRYFVHPVEMATIGNLFCPRCRDLIRIFPMPCLVEKHQPLEADRVHNRGSQRPFDTRLSATTQKKEIVDGWIIQSTWDKKSCP